MSDHLEPFRPRKAHALETARDRGWSLKRYAIIADERQFDSAVATAATTQAFRKLPDAGPLRDATGNHGIGFQIIHFAQTAVVSPVFYWQWGSVLAQLGQLKAPWDDPLNFTDGIPEIIGCIWEMNIVNHEVAAWTASMLGPSGDVADRLQTYLDANDAGERGAAST